MSNQQPKASPMRKYDEAFANLSPDDQRAILELLYRYLEKMEQKRSDAIAAELLKDIAIDL